MVWTATPPPPAGRRAAQCSRFPATWKSVVLAAMRSDVPGKVAAKGWTRPPERAMAGVEAAVPRGGIASCVAEAAEERRALAAAEVASVPYAWGEPEVGVGAHSH